MHTMTRRRALSAAAAIATLGALPALSPAAVARSPLRLTMVNLMPWASNGPNGQPIGALIELCVQLAALSGVPITPMPVPYGRAPHMLTSGGADLMLVIDVTIKGRTPIDYVGTVDIVIFGRDGFRFQHLDDLAGKTVGMLRHTSYSPQMEGEQRILKHAFDSYEQGLRMLQAGRLDAVIGVGDSIEYALAMTGIQVSPRYQLARGRVALYADAGIDTATVASLQAGCRQLRQKHVMDELLHRHQRR